MKNIFLNNYKNIINNTYLVGCIIISVVPAFLLAFLIFNNSVNIPHQDGWFIGLCIEKAVSGDLSIFDFFAQTNETRPLFPRLLFLLMANLTHWDVRYQMFFSFLIACLTISDGKLYHYCTYKFFI